MKSPNNTSWCFSLCPGLPFLRIFCTGNSDGFLAYLRWSFLHRSMVEPRGCSMPSLPEVSLQVATKLQICYRCLTHSLMIQTYYSLLLFRYSSKHVLASKVSQFKSWAPAWPVGSWCRGNAEHKNHKKSLIEIDGNRRGILWPLAPQNMIHKSQVVVIRLPPCFGKDRAPEYEKTPRYSASKPD